LNDLTDNRRFDSIATLACLGTVICWSSGPIFIKLLTFNLDLWVQNFLRYITACLFWLGFLIFSMRKENFNHSVWLRALLPAAANIVMQSLWVAGFYYINPAFMSLLGKTSTLWTAGFSLLLFVEERVLLKSKFFWLGLLSSIVGVSGVVIFQEDFALETTVGIFIVLGASFMWAVYVVTVKKAFKNIDSRIGFSVTSIYTVIGLGILAFRFGEVNACTQMNFRQWMYIVVSGISSIAIAHVLFYVAIKRIGATIPSLVILSVPFAVYGISRVVFGESLNISQGIFGIVLLIGCVLAVWAQKSLKNSEK